MTEKKPVSVKETLKNKAAEAKKPAPKAAVKTPAKPAAKTSAKDGGKPVKGVPKSDTPTAKPVKSVLKDTYSNLRKAAAKSLLTD